MLAVEFCDDGAKHPEGEKPEESKDLEQDAHVQLVLAYNDFAVQCFTQGFYSEATMLLTKAIHEQRDESGLFINRGGMSRGVGLVTLGFIHYILDGFYFSFQPVGNLYLVYFTIYSI